MATLPLLWSAADAAVNTVMLAHWFQQEPEVNATQQFKATFNALLMGMAHTHLDLWVLGVLRAVLLTFCIVFSIKRWRLWNRNFADVTYYATLMTCVGTWLYSCAKVLLLAEVVGWIPDSWRLVQVAWAYTGCIVCFVLVLRTRQIECSSSSSAANYQTNGTHEERRHQLETETESLKSLLAPSRMSTLSKLCRISAPDWPFVACGMLCLVLSVACEILIPFYVGHVIDSLVMSRPRYTFGDAMARLATVAACMAVSSWIRIWMLTRYCTRLTARIRQQLFQMIVHQDLSFFDAHETGDLVTTLMTDTALLGDSFSPNMDQCLRGGFTAVGVMALMLKTSWRLSIVSVTALPAFAANSYFYGVVMRQIGRSSQAIMADMGNTAQEVFSNIRTVRSFAMETKETDLFAFSVDRLKINGYKESWIHGCFQSLALMLPVSLQIVVLLYGGHLVHRQMLSGGGLVAFVLYLNQINTSFQIINSVYGAMMKGIGASTVVFQHLGRNPSEAGQGSIVKQHVRGEIEFKDVCFSYPRRPGQRVLNNLSFKVRAGEVVALVGPSGGGKSTCVSLLQNFYQPDCGQVLLDGVPVHRYQHQCLHSRMSMVGQEPVLFSRSIRQNIAYGLQACTESDITSAASQAYSHDFIMALPDGYDTYAGEKGLQLSGGQKQRLAIARVLIRQPSVLLLDEATSALDSQSEIKVQQAIEHSCWDGHRTVLIIAHRLSTVEKADRVLVIHNGHVVEEGTPSDLLNLGGMYASLARHQFQRSGSVPFASHGGMESVEDENVCISTEM